MKVYLAIQKSAQNIVESVTEYLTEKKVDFEIEIISNNIYDVCIRAVDVVREDLENNRAIIIDDYGILPFMITTKHKGIICAELSDEHSAQMTRDHNNTNIISIGYRLVGEEIIHEIVKRFIERDYSGGRHQIRIDMLDHLGGN